MVPSRIRVVFFVALAIATPAMLAAQAAPAQTPPVAQAATPAPMQPGMLLAIARMDIKPGKDMAVEKLEHAMARIHVTKNTGMPRVLAMNAVAGPGEAWIVVPLPDYAALDAVMEKWGQMPAPVQAEFAQLNEQEGALLNSGSMMLCRYLQEYSNNSSTDVSAYRLMQVITYRVRPGKGEDFLKGAKLYTDAMRKANPDGRWAMFQLVAGGYEGTYHVFIPLKKMADLTPDPARMKTFGEALGTEGQQKLQSMSDVVVSVTNNIFAFNPAMSTVAPVYAKSDPWWTWKTPGPVKTAAPAKPGDEKKKSVEPVKK